MGVKLNSGQLEITEVELVLHRRGKQPVKWPLRYHLASQADVVSDADFINLILSCPMLLSMLLLI